MHRFQYQNQLIKIYHIAFLVKLPESVSNLQRRAFSVPQTAKEEFNSSTFLLHNAQRVKLPCDFGDHKEVTAPAILMPFDTAHEMWQLEANGAGLQKERAAAGWGI